MTKPYRKSWFSLLCLLACITLFTWGQTAEQKPGQAAATNESREQKITPQEAKELFQSVDEVLQFASKDTGLPIKHDVGRQLSSRDQVVSYLKKNMEEDKDAQRLRRSELVLKKFGLLPADFNLETFLVALLREQVAGYYDAKTQTVNLLDWLDAEQQRPVLAHELTHALQDQSFGLEKWLDAGVADIDEKVQLTPEDFENDEISEARQAVVEGQAMAVLVDYMLAPAKQSLLTSPQLAETLKETMLTGTADSPEFKDAPIFLKEELTFPYRYGLDFTTELLRSGGKDKAFAGALTNPPRNSRQIMEPQTYLSGEHLPPIELPNFADDFKNYDRFDVGAIGEEDTSVLVEQYAGEKASKDLYPRWRGGYYYAVRPKGNASAPLALLYVSRWSDGESAVSFAAVYAKTLPKRYKQLHESEKDAENAVLNLPTLATLSGTHTWTTEDGPVVIAVQRERVVITEGVDPETTDRIKQELFGASAAK